MHTELTLIIYPYAEIAAAAKQRSKLEQKKMDLVVEKKKLSNKWDGFKMEA